MISEQCANHLIELLKAARKRPRDPVVLSYFDLVDLAEWLVNERERNASALNKEKVS
jgi:hypothetical protein